MATPTGTEADEARWFFARERRRKLQDLSAYKTAGLVPPSGTPFDFGAIAAGGVGNQLVLPADVDITLELDVPWVTPDFGVIDFTTSTVYQVQADGVANSRILLNTRFIKDHSIAIFRSVTSPAGNLVVYFSGPKSQLNQIGQAVFT